MGELIYTGEYYLRNLSPCTVVELLFDVGLFEPFEDSKQSFSEALNTAYRFGLIKEYLIEQLLDGYDLAELINKALTGELLVDEEESYFFSTTKNVEKIKIVEKAKILLFKNV